MVTQRWGQVERLDEVHIVEESLEHQTERLWTFSFFFFLLSWTFSLFLQVLFSFSVCLFGLFLLISLKMFLDHSASVHCKSLRMKYHLGTTVLRITRVLWVPEPHPIVLDISLWMYLGCLGGPWYWGSELVTCMECY